MMTQFIVTYMHHQVSKGYGETNPGFVWVLTTNIFQITVYTIGDMLKVYGMFSERENPNAPNLTTLLVKERIKSGLY